MISGLRIKNNLSFKEVNLSFGSGLSVFTGISGAGKSVLMEAILAVFGYKDTGASLVEADFEGEIKFDETGIFPEEINIFKLVKEKTTRYFINNQAVSKKNLFEISKSYLKYLSAKEISEFENDRLLLVIDTLASKNNIKFKDIKSKFSSVFAEFVDIKTQLDKILLDEQKIEELKDFARFEIQKIQSLNPKIGEFEELSALKKRLSKKDKITQAWQKADQIFALESAVIEALSVSEIESSFFSDAMNLLREERANLEFDDLDETDIEKLLDRIESLNSLQKRYGSIEEALEILKKRKIELERYEKIEFEKQELETKFNDLQNLVLNLADEITKSRNSVLDKFQSVVNAYLKALYLDEVCINLDKKSIEENGQDEVIISLNKANLKNLSSGEINRLRLAFIASEVEITEFGKGVLIMDEVDANLSGKEAMSVATVLLKLAKYYQIFAISHLPQLSSKAHHHFLVEKKNNISSVFELDQNARIDELARMISGEKIAQEAVSFAKKLLDIKE